ncbi:MULTISPECIES: MarR family winged helix-turn-helix transcriptional regulator [unclassified Janibacter]|uniref:MarR family winged helix-turn-helix transcriptional regulator n=1 Tax=unclassified Janibacter TaxID=2649294 RepID=UPI003CFD7AB3
MPTPDRDAAGDLGDLIQETARALRRRSMALLEPWDLAPHQARALRVAARHAPARLGTIAQHLHIAPRSATDVVDSLERRGLVRRIPDPADRRAVIVELTPAGQRLDTEMLEHRRTAAADHFSALSDRDRATLRRILTTLADERPSRS